MNPKKYGNPSFFKTVTNLSDLVPISYCFNISKAIKNIIPKGNLEQ